MKLLYITYKVDPNDTLVGFVVGWLRQMAEQVEQVQVVCLQAAPELDLPPNVTVHSLEKGRGGRLAVWGRFYRTVWGLRRQVNVVFCQFSPEYALAVWPLAALFGWPIALWYTHRHVDLKLRLAVAVVQKVFTASPESFQIETPKRVILGHGIDTKHFQPGATPVTTPLVVAVGRRAPIKHYEMLIDAAAALFPTLPDLQVRIVGGDEGSAPPNYAAQLQARIDAHGLREVVTLVGGVAYSQVLSEYQQAAVHVNLCPTGGLDKAVLEGMAAGVPTLVRNAGFAPLLGDLAAQCLRADGDLPAVTAALADLLQLSPAQRQAMGANLRARVLGEFGQGALVQRLTAQLRQLQR